MVESQAFSILFALILILVGLPLLLFGLLEFNSSPGLRYPILAISVLMLLTGGFFIIILFTQK